MKALVFGADGFLGQRAMHSLRTSGYETVGAGHRMADISDFDSVAKLADGILPDVIINCAAISDTGYSQQHPEESMKVNVLGNVNLARVAAASGAKYVFMSSDQVYEGCAVEGPLPEDLQLTPKRVYGCHKLLAEQQVAECNPDAVGLRLTWMYDFPKLCIGEFGRINTNIVTALEKAARDGTTLKACSRERRGLTWVWDVAAGLAGAIGLPGGIYNFGCGNSSDSFTSYCRIASILGMPDGTVQKDDSWTRNLEMCGGKAASFGIVFPETIDGFRSALEAAAK